jgi:hypothetical protein
MDTHFINGVVVSFIIGFIFCCVVLGFFVRRANRKRLRQDSSGYVAMSMISRGALQRLESGDVEGAKHELCGAIANFYHSFRGSSEHPQLLADVITSERRQIETQAQASAVLAGALRKKLDDKPVA